MLFDAKQVMDNAIPDLGRVRALIAKPLHERFDGLLLEFEETLAQCDVSDRYEEK
jgi:hypothetical protein